jgi:hypothetical protein
MSTCGASMTLMRSGRSSVSAGIYLLPLHNTRHLCVVQNVMYSSNDYTVQLTHAATTCIITLHRPLSTVELMRLCALLACLFMHDSRCLRTTSIQHTTLLFRVLTLYHIQRCVFECTERLCCVALMCSGASCEAKLTLTMTAMSLLTMLVKTKR